MARLTESLLGGRAYSLGEDTAMLNLAHGAQQGWAPNLGEIINNQAYIRRNLHCILLEAPKFFNLMPNPEMWYQSLKALFEVHARTIEGLNAGLKVEHDEHAVGGGGEFQQEVTDVKRDRSEPVMGFVEKYGMPIQTLLEYWIRYGHMDPDTKYPLITTLSGEKPSDLLLDWNTATCLFFEPDPTHTKIQKAWITTNMMPKGTGEIIGKKELQAASEVLNLSIEFTGVSQYNRGAKVLAQRILDSINKTNANPYLRSAFLQGPSADVDRAPEGFKKSVEDIGANAVV